MTRSRFRPRRRRTRVAAMMACATSAALLATGCGASAGQRASGPSATAPRPSAPAGASSSTSVPTSLSPSSSVATPRNSTSTAGPPPVTKLLVFMVENHSADQMRAQMPYLRALADRYGYAEDYTAAGHPSLPNYLAIAGGSTFGVADDAGPSAHPLVGPSVFGEAVAHGSTARLYAEAMPAPCEPAPQGAYAVKHNPWVYFRDEAALCRRADVPLAAFASDVAHGRLPAVGMVIPDLCDDGHDCPLATADGWLRAHVGLAMRGPDWASGRLAIVVTADEDDDAHGNQVLTVVADPALHHRVVATPLGHYALSRAYADVAGVAPLRRAAGAPDLLRSFGLAVR